MNAVEIASTITIATPAETVRRQFGDVGYHAAVGVHRGTRFDVVTDKPDRCDYTQTTSVGPVRLRQHVTLDRVEVGPLVNTITRGPLTGGAITFDVTDRGGVTQVRAELWAPLRGAQRLVAPLLRWSARRALERALTEDKHDLESGRYARWEAACHHP